MNLKYITCSDPREFNDIHDIVKLGQLSPRVEIAIQAHPSKMSPGMPRYQWTQELMQLVKGLQFYNSRNINLAVHVNKEWCAEICKTGKFPAELQTILSQRYTLFPCKTVIGRIQLNIPADAVPKADVDNMIQLFDENRDYKFIIQYNRNTEDLVKKIRYFSYVPFSTLYDASGGRGISPGTWREPVFVSGDQGYSGGMSPENVAENLDKISAVVPFGRDVWIDAEGKLKTDDKFDIGRAQQYIMNAENWLARQKQR